MHTFFQNKQSLLLLFGIFFTFSCQPNKQDSAPIPVIKADVTSNAELNLSDYFENFRMLKLPTDTLIGEIEKIKFENNRIYISDGLSLSTFSEQGKLLSYLEKRGQGPNEYHRIEDFTVEGETITILDRDQQKMITYDHNGNGISTTNLTHSAQAISPKINNSFFLYNGFDPSKKLYRFKNGEEDSTYLNVNENQSHYLFIFTHHNFFQYGKSIYFFQAINDTIYESINGGKMLPSFFIDFEGKNIPSSFFNKRYKDVKDFFDKLHNRPYGYGIYSFVINKEVIMFGSFYEKTKKLTIFNRKNKSSNTFASISDNIYFKGLSIPVSQFIYHANKNGQVIVPIDAPSIVEWRKNFSPSIPFEKMINMTKEEDNPILLIFDFKNKK